MPRLEDLQNLLLDLISTHRPVDPSQVGALGEEEWGAIQAMVRQHRLGPLLHWRLTRERTDVPVPDDFRAVLAASFKTSALRALIVQREILLTHDILDRAGVPCVVLKGADLAYSVYPSPALRPMRDLDLLVPEQQGLDAYQVLLDAGYRRMDSAPGDPRASLLVSKKHFPPLRSVSNHLIVELHVRLISPEIGQAPPAEVWDVWDRLEKRDLGGRTIAYLAPTDLLLHLTVHAAYEHRFDNGPVLLPDVAYLVHGAAIDWPLFWRMAAGAGWSNGCVLVLKMAERYGGVLPIDYQEFAATDGVDAIVTQCAPLMLSDEQAHIDIRLGGVLSGKSGREKLSVMCGKLFPSRARIAAEYPVAVDSFVGAIRGYLMKYLHLLTRRVPGLLSNRKNAAVRDSIQKASELERWLSRR